ncbi:MAG TPA: HD domain-containing protein [Desulfobacteria bacterium]|nr:HD domain-containing protein [Desulfobacteria bacterium]
MPNVIRDPLHGYIELDELASAIIDTAEMQRLRRIRQLGFSYLVYPGANHTRFEHSLGTYHLMNVLLNRLEVAKEEEQELLVAALIHDVGHGPYSHVTEPLIKRLTGKGHEDLESVLFAEENVREKDAETAAAPTIAEVVEAHHLDIRKILGYIKGEKTEGVRKRDLSRILNGEIDVDKMDYLVRDSYYTGVAYGVVDNIRLIQGLNFFDDELVLTEKGVLPAEYLLFSRFLMHPTVYNHHTGRIAQLMLLNALDAFIESSAESKDYAAALRTMDDSEINIALRNAGGYPNEMITRLNERRLFKRAIYTNVSELDASAAEGLRDARRMQEVVADISKRAGVDKKYVLLDYQKPKGRELEEGAARVVIGNEFRSLRDVSSLVAMLSREFERNYKIGVYTPEEHRAKVKKAAEEILWK